MRSDRTVERSYLQRWRLLIAEYESVQMGAQRRSAQSATYKYNGTRSQTFRKYYNRYLAKVVVRPRICYQAARSEKARNI